MRTAQEIFDTVVNHLRQQNATALSEDGFTCAYRGRNGTRCSVGILIPDELYSPQMEGHNLRHLMGFNLIPSPLKEEFATHLNLLTRLQSVHDSREIYNWEAGFSSVANDFKLQYTPPTV